MKRTSTNVKLFVPDQTVFRNGLLLVLPALVFGILCLAGCHSTTPQYAPLTTAAPSAESSPSTRFQEGDVIRVVFETETNLNTVVKIQVDGLIIMPMVGEVKAIGLTSSELQVDLMRRYERILKMNQLSVTIVSSAASVYVSGAVLRPGRIPMERPLTALDAIMEAGGFDPIRAKPSAVTILRLENGQQKHYELDLKRALQGKQPTPFYLKPFDIVHVPEKVWNL